MINPKEQQNSKIMELFEQMGQITSDEKIWIQDYLAGEADEGGLEKLAFRDMSGAKGAARMNSLFGDLVYKGKNELAGKLGKVLFALGQSTSYQMFPNYIFNHYSSRKNPFFMAPEIETAIYANIMGYNSYQIGKNNMQNLVQIAKKDLAVVEKAIGYQKDQRDNGRFVLLALYFLIKYPDLNSEAKITEAKRSFSEQDAEYMETYEGILVNSIANLYKNQLSEPDYKAVLHAVEHDGVDKGIMEIVGNSAVNQFLLQLLGGMSFINYHLSIKLKNVLKLCLASGTEAMLGYMDKLDLRNDLRARGGNFDDVFGVSSQKLLVWAAKNKKLLILTVQFRKNREYFMEYMDQVDFYIYNMMEDIIKKEAPEMYKERGLMDIGRQRQQVEVMNRFTELLEGQAADVVRDYLAGGTGVETLYAREGDIFLKNSRYWVSQQDLKAYEGIYGQDDFCARCEVLMMVSRMITYSFIMDSGNVNGERVRKMFASADAQKLDLKHQLNGFVDLSDSFYAERSMEIFQKEAAVNFKKYLEERRDEMIAAFQGAESIGRNFGLSLLAKDTERNKEVILGFTQDSAKSVRGTLLSILYGQKGWEGDITRLLSSKKAAEREIAIRVLEKWDIGKYGPLLREAYEKEKNAKVRALFENVLRIEKEGVAGDAGTGDLVKDLLKGNKKRSLAWAYETPFSKVHKKDGEEAEEGYLQAIFLCYSSMGKCGISQSAASLAAELNEGEFAVYVNELFDKWLAAGAEAKKRWVLYAAAIHGGADIVKKFQHQIQEWPQAARGSIAADAVQALALSPQPQALLIVDGIARKFKFKQVKAAAGKALEFAASQLGITTEELADRIVPDLGFDENMERCFDYGGRKFTVMITTALEIEVFDENKKKLKGLPAPGKRDDGEKAAAAYEEFKQMKKQMKATISSQKNRLELALTTGREWDIQAWKNLFVKNPIMHQFAIGLVWGIYKDRELAGSFRYMEDGSFNTEDEEEFEMPETGKIGLVHPIELSKESRAAWKEQLEDYEIVQPIEQINRQVYYKTEEEEGSRHLERFGGCIISDLTLGGKLTGFGWYRGSVQDAGGFYTYYREDPELSLGVELHFSGSYVGSEGEDVTVYDARFYKAGEVARGSYVYDEADDKKAYVLKDIPGRYFSEIVLQLAKALASSKEKDADWKAGR